MDQRPLPRKELQSSSNESIEHVERGRRVAPGHHVAGVPHHEEPQVLDGLQVADGVATGDVGVLLRSVEEILSGPVLHGLEHLEHADVVADDVEVAVVNEHLGGERMDV